MIKARFMGIALSLLAIGGMIATTAHLVRPAPVLAGVSNSTKLNRVVKADGAFKNLLDSNIDVVEEQEASNDYETAYTVVTDALDAVEEATLAAKKSVPYVLFANVQEKQTLYAALSAIIAQVEAYKADLTDINAQYGQDGDVDAALSALQVKNAEIATYLEEHKDEFGAQIRTFLEARLESGLANTELGITFLTAAKDAYVDLGKDTTTLEKRLSQVQSAYDLALEKYEQGKTAGDTKKMLQSAQWLLAARVVLISAQGAVDNLENEVLN